MPTVPGSARVSLIGTLSGGEQFDTSFWTLGGAGSQGDLQDLVDGVAGVLTASNAMLNTLQLIPTNSSYDSVRGYAYPNGGTQASWVAEAALSLPGTKTAHLPDQSALVVSLRTTQVGRSARGRMYLPANGATLSTDGVLSTAPSSQDVADEWATILSAVNGLTVGGGNPTVLVVSFTNTSSLPVTHVVVDSRLDIQRRRANKQVISPIGQADLS